jgi:hypothetical protein
MSPDEPVELLELLCLADEHVLGHQVEFLRGIDRRRPAFPPIQAA